MENTNAALNLKQLAEEQTAIYTELDKGLQKIHKELRTEESNLEKISGRAKQYPTIELFKELEESEKSVMALGKIVSNSKRAVASYKKENSRGLSTKLHAAEMGDYLAFKAYTEEKEAAVLEQLKEAISAFNTVMDERADTFDEVSRNVDQVQRYLEQIDVESVSRDSIYKRYMGTYSSQMKELTDNISKAIDLREGEL